MNGSTGEDRFHRWLASRAPDAVPPGLLSRAMADLERPPRRQGAWSWLRARSTALAPALASLTALAIVAALVMSFLPKPPPVAEASPSATSAATGSPDGSAQPATFSPSATPIETGTPEPTLAPGPTPTAVTTAAPTAVPTPVPTPIETAPPPGDPGTLTFRLVLDEMPPDTARMIIDLGYADPQDPDGWLTHTTPPSYGGFALCGGGANPAPCTAPMTYQQTFSDLLPEVRWSYSVFVEQTSGGRILLKTGQLTGDGSVIVARYPVPVTPGPVPCSAFDGLADEYGELSYGQSGAYQAAADLCLYQTIWVDVAHVQNAASGTAILTVDDRVVYRLAISPWYGFGSFCAGSTERCVVFDPPIAMAAGQTLELHFEDCPECSEAIYVHLYSYFP